MTDEETLKPCPFCGLPARKVSIGTYFRIQCSDELDKCFLSLTYMRPEEWNTRASDEKLEKCIEFIKETAEFPFQEGWQVLSHTINEAKKLLEEIGELE